MTKPDPPTKDEINPESPLARVDGSSSDAVIIIRKFLQSHGCTVVDDTDIPRQLMYHIVIGEVSLVKTILANCRDTSERLFLVVHSATVDDVKTFVEQWGAKVWLSTHAPTSPEAVDVLFAFFFAGTTPIHGQAAPTTRSEQSERITEFQKDDETNKRVDEETNIRVTLPVGKTTSRVEDEWEQRKQNIGSLLSEQAFLEIKPQPNQKGDLFTRLSGRKKLPFLRSTGQFSKTHEQSLPRGRYKFIVYPFFVFCLIFLWYMMSMGLVGGFLTWGVASIAKGDQGSALRFSQLSELFIHQNRIFIQILAYPLEAVGQVSRLRSQERMLSFYADIAKSVHEGSNLIEHGKEVASLLLTKDGTTNSSPALAIERLKQSVGKVLSSTSQAAAELRVLLEEKPLPLGVSMLLSFLQKQQVRLAKERDALASMNKFLELYPIIAGFKQKKTYLVLLQNSAELRPTGGFIGSVALASFQEGTLQDISVQDVYALDGQLKGHIDPPQPLREQMNQEHWYLRDSNWNPDFSVSGPRAAWFYQKETGITVDGVIAVNSPFIVDILRVMGPVQLVDYNDTITADNFYAKSLFYTHAGFFPGSTQKKDFLGSLLTTLMSRVTNTNSVSMPALLKAVSLAFDQGDILFSFEDPQTENLARYFGWGGTVSFRHTCGDTKQACFSDGISIVDANLGVNKVNYFITRKQEHAVKIGEEGSIREESSSTYHNSSPSDDPTVGGGVYKDYARWYVPDDATISAILSGGVAIPLRDPTSPTPPPLPYAEIDRSVPGWLIIGVAFSVAPLEDKRISVGYKRQKVFPVESERAYYHFTNITQPGMKSGEFSLSIAYPILWTIQADSGATETSLVAKEGRVQYNSQARKTQTIYIGFSK